MEKARGHIFVVTVQKKKLQNIFWKNSGLGSSSAAANFLDRWVDYLRLGRDSLEAPPNLKHDDPFFFSFSFHFFYLHLRVGFGIY